MAVAVVAVPKTSPVCQPTSTRAARNRKARDPVWSKVYAVQLLQILIVSAQLRRREGESDLVFAFGGRSKKW
jgi:hypothetical protein